MREDEESFSKEETLINKKKGKGEVFRVAVKAFTVL